MNLAKIKESALADIKKIKTPQELESLRIKYLGRKSALTGILRSLGNLPLAKRRELGPLAQALRRELEELLRPRSAGKVFPAIRDVDITAPAKKIGRGHPHPLTVVEQEARRIFSAMNFSVADGPEMETEYYNFDALNIPPDHPARDMWDTFWLEPEEGKPKTKNERLLLRTHTSPVQMRYMQEYRPPLQVIVPGRVFRYEATDASHEINFYQLEGLMVGKNINLSNFKFVVEEFLKKFFAGKRMEFRYRPSYFPFVEPGLEVDVKLTAGGGRQATKWLEVMGAGMVHPRVFEYAHYNPRDWQGFAFGLGLDRLAMIKYKIPDIRLFYSGDLRFIKQF